MLINMVVAITESNVARLEVIVDLLWNDVISWDFWNLVHFLQIIPLELRNINTDLHLLRTSLLLSSVLGIIEVVFLIIIEIIVILFVVILITVIHLITIIVIIILVIVVSVGGRWCRWSWGSGCSRCIRISLRLTILFL